AGWAAPWGALYRLRAIACAASVSTATGQSMTSKATRAMLPATKTMSASSRLRSGWRELNGFDMRRAHESGEAWRRPARRVATARDCRDVVAMTLPAFSAVLQARLDHRLQLLRNRRVVQHEIRGESKPHEIIPAGRGKPPLEEEAAESEQDEEGPGQAGQVHAARRRPDRCVQAAEEAVNAVSMKERTRSTLTCVVSQVGLEALRIDPDDRRQSLRERVHQLGCIRLLALVHHQNAPRNRI